MSKSTVRFDTLRTDPGVALAVLRVILGAIFVYHGFGKLTGIEQTAGFFGAVGIPAAGLAAWTVALLEFFGGLALVMGTLARPAAALLVPVMIGAIVTVHAPSGFANTNIVGMSESGPVFGMPGWEFNLILIAALMAIALGGAGRAALDPAAASAVGRGQAKAAPA